MNNDNFTCSAGVEGKGDAPRFAVYGPQSTVHGLRFTVHGDLFLVFEDIVVVLCNQWINEVLVQYVEQG